MRLRAFEHVSNLADVLERTNKQTNIHYTTNITRV